MNVLKFISILLTIFTFSITEADILDDPDSGKKSSIGNNQNDKTGSGPSGSDVKSGTTALARITGDSRVAAVGNIYMAKEFYEKANGAGLWGAAWFYTIAISEVAQAVDNLKTSKSSKRAGGYLGADGLGQSGISSGSNHQSADGINSGEFNLEDEFTGLSNDSNIKDIYGNIPDLNKLKSDLEKTGINRNEDTGEYTLADGTKLSQADLAKAANKFLNSAKGKKLQANLAKKRLAYLNRVSRFKSGDGGGYKSSARRKASSKSKRPGFNFNFGNKKGSRGIASVPGKVKMVNGDPLGAASDNVFHIVERAYQGLVSTKVLQEKVPRLGK